MTTATHARRYALLTGLRWFPTGLVVPVLVLLLAARGLDVAGIGRLMALFSLVVVVLELPTGGMADAIGRRPVLAASSVLAAAGSVLLALATSIVAMAAAIVLLGVGRALGSGPLEAWYVDTVRAQDPTADIGPGIARAQAVEAVSLGVGALIGGLLPALAASAGFTTVGPDRALIPMSVPFLASAALLLVHAATVLALVGEPAGGVPQAGPASRPGLLDTVVAGVTLVARSADLRRLIGYAAILGITLSGVELVSPVAFSTRLGGPDRAGSGYGLLVGLGFGAAALGAVLAPRVARRFGSARLAAAALALALAPVVLLIAAPALAPAAAAFVVFYLVLGANGPVLAGLLHDRVAAAQRSTVLSVESLALQLGAIGASVAIGGLVARAGAPAGYAVIAVALVGGALLLRGVQDRADQERREAASRPTTSEPNSSEVARVISSTARSKA